MTTDTAPITEPDLFRGYAPTTRAAQDHALRVVIEERIATLWLYRKWWRANRWADWPAERLELDGELRALVRLVRAARRVTAPDPITEAKAWQDGAVAYHDWQAGR